MRIGILFFILSTFINLSCLNEPSKENNNLSFPALPSLQDQIPFEKLGKGKIVFERIGPFENNYSGIYIINLDNKSTNSRSGTIWGSAISPDGNKIAYKTLTPYPAVSYYDIYIMNSDGTGSSQVTNIEGQEGPPSWTPDSKKILYNGTPFKISPSLLCPIYRQSPVLNSPDNELVVDLGLIDYPNIFIPISLISVSNSGKLALSAYGLRTFNNAGKENKVLVSVLGSGGIIYSPVWSKDGKMIYYLSVNRDSAYTLNSISVMKIPENGGTPETIISMKASGKSEWAGENNHSLCLSPSGDKLLFNIQDGENLGAHLWMINTGGSNLIQVTFLPNVTDRSVSWGN